MTPPNPSSRPASPPPDPRLDRHAGADSSPRWRSDHLLAGAPEALIEHGGSTYRLRLTQLGKLILTK